MFNTLGNLFASGPRLKYDLEGSFGDVASFGAWTHARGRCQVRSSAGED
jgi:hypothetical protein